MESSNFRVCKRCLLSDTAPEEYLENMRNYLKGIPEAAKAEDNLYNERLKECRACDNLSEGLCRLCGCFVEYRAAIKAKNCPGLHPRW